MFDFLDLPEDDALRTAWGRYLDRRITWYGIVGNWTWWPRHYFWWVVHNIIAHILIGLIPIKTFFDFHDWTSKRLAGDHLDYRATGLPWWKQLLGKTE
jgi:hypothetical protein